MGEERYGACQSPTGTYAHECENLDKNYVDIGFDRPRCALEHDTLTGDTTGCEKNENIIHDRNICYIDVEVAQEQEQLQEQEQEEENDDENGVSEDMKEHESAVKMGKEEG